MVRALAARCCRSGGDGRDAQEGLEAVDGRALLSFGDGGGARFADDTVAACGRFPGQYRVGRSVWPRRADDEAAPAG